MPVKDILEYICMYTRKVNEDGQKGKASKNRRFARRALLVSAQSNKSTRPGRVSLKIEDQCSWTKDRRRGKNALLDYGKKNIGPRNTCETSAKRDERWKTETRTCLKSSETIWRKKNVKTSITANEIILVFDPLYFFYSSELNVKKKTLPRKSLRFNRLLPWSWPLVCLFSLGKKNGERERERERDREIEREREG